MVVFDQTFDIYINLSSSKQYSTTVQPIGVEPKRRQSYFCLPDVSVTTAETQE